MSTESKLEMGGEHLIEVLGGQGFAESKSCPPYRHFRKEGKKTALVEISFLHGLAFYWPDEHKQNRMHGTYLIFQGGLTDAAITQFLSFTA